MNEDFRNLPSVDRLMRESRIKGLESNYPHELVADLVRVRLDELRTSIAQGNPCPPFEEIVDSIIARAAGQWRSSLMPVINATGVVLHTNLGRAPLSQEAIAAAVAVSQTYSNLEFDLETGQRGSRYSHVEHLLRQVTGAEAAMVVNNNASAVLLGLSALAKGREVIVSRGQAVEIGGGFRVPDVMRQSGAKLVEVGTTNRTYLSDYEEAITPRTAALLRVHTSNFRVIGFTHSVALEEMVELAAKHSLLVLDDLGSGCLLDTTTYGLGEEPKVQASVKAGADLVFFSGDKLLGGPQAGIIVGKSEPMAKLKKHPLARAIRIDKMNLAALSATLLHYLRNEAVQKVPVWQMIAAPLLELEARARRLAQALGDGTGVIDGRSMIGGGSLPEESLPTKLVSFRLLDRQKERELGGIKGLADKLRRLDSPVIARIEKDALLLDLRTVLPGEDEKLLASLRKVLSM